MRDAARERKVSALLCVILPLAPNASGAALATWATKRTSDEWTALASAANVNTPSADTIGMLVARLETL
jgi:hypothetical protein